MEVAVIENIARPTPRTIARMQAEATASNGWLVIEDTARRIFLLAGNTICCHDDGVEFTDDDGAACEPRRVASGHSTGEREDTDGLKQ